MEKAAPKYNAAIMKLFDSMPLRIRTLPISEKGYPVPWFVSKKDGEWNFVGVDSRKPMEAHRRQLCWVCGDRLGTYKSFPIGPMCVCNRVTSEPPSHLSCAVFSVKACPFLINPRMTRNYKAMPEDERNLVPGIALDRNPGVVAIWTTRSYEIFNPGVGHGKMFRLGDPASVSWWREGRTATRKEIDHSIDTGMPFLRELAEAEGAEAVKALQEKYEIAQSLLPEATP